MRIAGDFREFCRRNPKPCPLLDVTEPGSPTPIQVAPQADLRTDLPKYRIWKRGELADEVTDIRDLWRDDFVSFLIGCLLSTYLFSQFPVHCIDLFLI